MEPTGIVVVMSISIVMVMNIVHDSDKNDYFGGNHCANTVIATVISIIAEDFNVFQSV